MPLDEDVARLAKGKNLATVVTLMPNGQPHCSMICLRLRPRVRPMRWPWCSADEP